MKIAREDIRPDEERSFHILLTPNLNDLFYWHFHPEYEIVYVEAPAGLRHVGDHISRYEGSDLVLIGPNIPHLNFDYGVKTRAETVVVQMKEDFLGKGFLSLPETKLIHELLERAREGIAFYGETRDTAGEMLKRLPGLTHFEQLMELLRIFQFLAQSKESLPLQARPVAHASMEKEQHRMQRMYRFIEANYQRRISVEEMAALCHLTPAAFCRYFKKTTRLTFTKFLNQYRVNQAKKLLIHDRNVTEAGLASGFDNLSHFNKTFRSVTGENPSHFRKRHQHA